MIYVVCGLIGSGKSTYAYNHYDYMTELEDYGTKDKQIQATIAMHNLGRDVAHITCYPTQQESDAFGALGPEYIMIDTDPLRAKNNILSRHRESDMKSIRSVLKKNTMLWDKLLRSDITFTRVCVCESPVREMW